MKSRQRFGAACFGLRNGLRPNLLGPATMFVLLMPMLLFAFVFLRLAKEKGLPPARFMLFPLVSGGALALGCHVLAWGVEAFVGGGERAMLHSTVAGVLALVVFFTVNARVWKRLKALPPARGPG